MKRTNVTLDEHLLKQIVILFGTKTYSDALNQAMAEVLRISQVKGLAEFTGSNLWDGSLSEMRQDKDK